MVVCSASAQEKKSDKVISFGIRAGVNICNMSASTGESYAKTSSAAGFNIGAVMDIQLVRNYFYLQPGLYLSRKSLKLEAGATSSNGYYTIFNETAHPTYLEVPILLSGRFNLAKNAQFQINFGPYIACGIFGKYKWDVDEFLGGTGKYSNWTSSEEGDCFGNSDGGFKTLDFGLSAGLGVTIARHYYIGAAYEIGLTNIVADSDYSIYDYKIRNRNLMFSLGYTF